MSASHYSEGDNKESRLHQLGLRLAAARAQTPTTKVGRCRLDPGA